MTANIRPIIVPWDFSEKAHFALQHAIQIAKVTDTYILLVHITKKESDSVLQKDKIEIIANNIEKQYKIKPQFIVRSGNIFTEISKVIDETNAVIAVMGTHGIKGFQKITGSWALKVIVSAKVPFIVVQDKPQPNTDVTKIVLPIDFKLEEREKLIWTSFISNIYKCKFYICYVDSDDQVIHTRTINNIKAAISYLEKHNINYELHQLSSENGIAKETIEFAKKVNGGLIITMTTKNIKFQDYIFGANEQQIIANSSKIPVMCVNPKANIK